DDEGEDDRQHAGQQSEAGTVDEAAEQVASGLVRAEYVALITEFLEPADDRSLHRIVRGHPWREDRHQDDQQQDGRYGQRDLVLAQPLPDAAPIALALLRPLQRCSGVDGDGGTLDHVHGHRRIRGSITACRMSTRMLITTKIAARTRIVPDRTATSRRKMARFIRLPEPGQLKTVSTRMEPPRR